MVDGRLSSFVIRHWLKKEEEMKAILAVVLVLAVFGQITAQPQAPEVIWSLTTSLGCFNSGQDVIQTSDGGFLLVGDLGINSVYPDLLIAKFDENGNREYWQTYGGEYSEAGICVYPTYNGKYIIGANGNGDIWLIELDDEYQIVWDNTIGWSLMEYTGDLKYIPDEGYIIVGSTASLGAGGYDILLLKTDLLGNETWHNTFGGSGYDYGYGIDLTPEGGYIIAGKTLSYGSGLSDLWLIKTDMNGNEIWSDTFGGEYSEGGSAVMTVNDGYVISGSTSSYSGNPDASDAWILKTDFNGNILWSTTSGDILPDYGYGLSKTSNGSFVTTGYIWSYGANNANSILMEVDSMGVLQWFLDFGRWESDDRGFGLCTTFDSGYAISGWTNVNSTSYTVCLVRLGYSSSCIAEYSRNYTYNPVLLCDFYLHPPSPNPFNTETLITFDLPFVSQIELSAYDISGREISVIAEGEYPAGRHTVTFDGSGLSSGIYFIRLQAGEQIMTKKCVLVK